MVCRRILEVGEEYEDVGIPHAGGWKQFPAHKECSDVFHNNRPSEKERRKRYEDQKKKNYVIWKTSNIRRQHHGR